SGTSRNEAWLRAGVAPDIPRGGIGSIGTATTGTHTRYNNCFYGGVAYGLFWEDHFQIGVAHARGKIQMYNTYNEVEPHTVGTYCYWNTLMGDPATEIWTGYPQTLHVSYPSTLPMGANAIQITVKGSDYQPIEGAWVYLHKYGLIEEGRYTDSNGVAEFPIDTSTPATVQVTVTGHNLYPHLGSFSIALQNNFVGLDSYEVDDDLFGSSEGNNNGVCNPGETVELRITLKNYGSQDAEEVSLGVDVEDPYIAVFTTDPISYGDIGAGEAATGAPFVFRLAQSTPHGHTIHLGLNVESGLSSWYSAIDLAVESGDLVYVSHELEGVGTRLDPGDWGTLAVTLQNLGTVSAPGPIQATLVSYDYAIQVHDHEGTYGTITPGGSGTNSSDLFGIHAPSDCIPGHEHQLKIILRYADGTMDTAYLSLEVGEASSTDPTGPDDYGYYAYDNSDTGYDEAPTFSWVNINPNQSGPGSSIGLTDYGWDQDDSKTIDLPFPFKFYGETYTRLTVCSNGWAALGSTYLTNYRNWHLPSAGGPGSMLAPFWDNLYQYGSGGVYKWYDENNHRFVIAWDDVRNRNSGSYESFELILYDPVYYPTVTGDGVIVFQYETVNNNDTEQMYATVGIQDQEHTTGITFNYFNRRPSTAAPLASGLAIKFTTGSPGASDAAHRFDRPDRLELLAYPNPATPGRASVEFALPERSPVLLRIVGVDGHLIRTLMDGVLSGGTYRVRWDGLDEFGRPVGPGLYFYDLESKGTSITRKILLVR
ncbi:MAG: hypothetical protein ACP6IT_08550, partial [Candidatus Thorarchaeota archaeon]